MLLDLHKNAASVASKIGRTLGIYHTYTVDDHYAILCVVLNSGDHLSCTHTACKTTPCSHASPDAS